MDNEQLEKEIQEKGLTAPRVSLASIHEKMKTIEYVEYETRSGSILRWCVIELENGFTATGRPSVSVSAENDDVEIGEKVAYDNALNEVWPLEGYLLKQKLHEQS
jgi:hypothetical protein